MIKNVYDKYFQKSRVFLYPLIGVLRKYKEPINTYTAYESYTSHDKKLFCIYDYNSTFVETEIILQKLNNFEKQEMLPEHKMLFMFDLNECNSDWEHFIKGRYSRFSSKGKQLIKKYHIDNVKQMEYINSYLHPHEYMNIYSELLNIPLDILQNVGELCDVYNEQKETLIIKNKLTKSYESNNVSS